MRVFLLRGKEKTLTPALSRSTGRGRRCAVQRNKAADASTFETTTVSRHFHQPTLARPLTAQYPLGTILILPPKAHHGASRRSPPVSPRRGAGGAEPFTWQTDKPEAQGLSSAKLDEFRDGLAKHSTAALLVVRHDKIVYEWYGQGFGPEKRHGTASLAKAVVGGMSLAVAMQDGRVRPDDAACKYIPEWRQDPRKSKITIAQLATHTSGSMTRRQSLEQPTTNSWVEGRILEARADRSVHAFPRHRARPVRARPARQLQQSGHGDALLRGHGGDPARRAEGRTLAPARTHL